MSKLYNIFLSFLILFLFVSCNKQPSIPNLNSEQEYSKADLEENTTLVPSPTTPEEKPALLPSPEVLLTSGEEEITYGGESIIFLFQRKGENAYLNLESFQVNEVPFHAYCVSYFDQDNQLFCRDESHWNLYSFSGTKVTELSNPFDSAEWIRDTVISNTLLFEQYNDNSKKYEIGLFDIYNNTFEILLEFSNPYVSDKWQEQPTITPGLDLYVAKFDEELLSYQLNKIYQDQDITYQKTIKLEGLTIGEIAPNPLYNILALSVAVPQQYGFYPGQLILYDLENEELISFDTEPYKPFANKSPWNYQGERLIFLKGDISHQIPCTITLASLEIECLNNFIEQRIVDFSFSPKLDQIVFLVEEEDETRRVIIWDFEQNEQVYEFQHDADYIFWAR